MILTILSPGIGICLSAVKFEPVTTILALDVVDLPAPDLAIQPDAMNLLVGKLPLASAGRTHLLSLCHHANLTSFHPQPQQPVTSSVRTFWIKSPTLMLRT